MCIALYHMHGDVFLFINGDGQIYSTATVCLHLKVKITSIRLYLRMCDETYRQN